MWFSEDWLWWIRGWCLGLLAEGCRPEFYFHIWSGHCPFVFSCLFSLETHDPRHTNSYGLFHRHFSLGENTGAMDCPWEEQPLPGLWTMGTLDTWFPVLWGQNSTMTGTLEHKDTNMESQQYCLQAGDNSDTCLSMSSGSGNLGDSGHSASSSATP
jgi:hypothetical protein